MPFTAGQQPTADQMNRLPGQCIARGRRTTSSTTTTTEVGVLRLDDIPIYAGRTYKIWTTPLQLDTSVANDVVRAVLRHTTDASTPTTSSAILTVCQVRADDATNPYTATIDYDHSPAADETLSLLLTVTRVSGTGSVGILAAATSPIDVVVQDMGDDPGDTGTDI